MVATMNGVGSPARLSSEVGKEQDKPEQAFRQRHRHESEDLSEQKFGSRNVGDVDLKDGLLLPLFGHRQRGQEGGNIEIPRTKMPGP